VLRAKAYAKLNLALHVQGRRADGYHNIDSVVAFCDVADVISVAPASDISLQVTGPFMLHTGDVQGNLVLRAAHLLAELAGVSAGAAITLEKNIPVGAGLGGGSADAAAVLKLLCAHWQLQLPKEAMQHLAVRLGADVPMCLQGGVLRARGIGDVIDSFLINDLFEYSVVLVYPNMHVATAQIYQNISHDNKEEGLNFSPTIAGLFTATRNDLQPAAITVAPVIAELLLALETLPQQADFVRMTGSGSCCFALFDEAERAASAARWLALKYPDWWIKTAAFLT
jgi:4-diphosphocytidyl-2-C-methyl-D-erythritol kinase